MFKLDFNIPTSSRKIVLNDSIYLIGSCFSDEMSKHLANNKFDHLANPFGTIYNPISQFKLLSDQAESDQLIESNSVYYHWDAHGSISGLTEEEVGRSFTHQNKKSQEFLKKAKWLIITLGTSYVYEYQKVGIVANCHKIPANHFTKRLLSQSEIIDSFKTLHSYLAQNNPDLNILFTVSPVRHIRDGIVENNRSKSILIDAVHHLADLYENVDYFPSYEIIMDELRDYRFFQKDMIHPTSEASEYVWGKFAETYFDSPTTEVLSQWNKLINALNHKPLQPDSKSHQDFLKNTLKKIKKMSSILDVDAEIKQLENQIKKG